MIFHDKQASSYECKIGSTAENMTDTKGELVFVRMEIAVLLTDRKDKKDARDKNM